LVEAITQNKCVVFVGAGLSQAAGYPGWVSLLERLTGECLAGGHIATERANELRRLVQSGDSLKLLMAAEELRDRFGPDLFVARLADTFQDETKLPTPVHKELPKVPFRMAITTNYDKLLEYAYAEARGGRTPPTYTSNDASDFADALFKEKFCILKAHGDVEKRTTMVITEKDYRNIFYRLPGYKTALSSIFTTKSVLFLGASLSDPELWLLLGFLHDAFHGSGTYHFALVPRGDASETMFNRWKNDFSVFCIHYEPTAGHPEVLKFVQSLPHVD
jgi:hypothetical protein